MEYGLAMQKTREIVGEAITASRIENNGKCERMQEDNEQHHNVARSRGGSNKTVNLTPVEPRRHDRYHDITGNALPTEVLCLLATDTVGYARNKTIEPRQLNTIYQIATMMDWPELYKPGSVTPSGTVESLARHPRTLFRHATEHQVAEMFHLDCALNGLDHGNGFGWQKAHMLRPFMKFMETLDDPIGAMRGLLTEEYEGRLTWVDALQDQTRRDLLGTLHGMELVPLTRNAIMELKAVIEKQRAHIAAHYRQWMATYQAHYGQRRKERRSESSRRGRGRY